YAQDTAWNLTKDGSQTYFEYFNGILAESGQSLSELQGLVSIPRSTALDTALFPERVHQSNNVVPQAHIGETPGFTQLAISPPQGGVSTLVISIDQHQIELLRQADPSLSEADLR